MIPITKPFLPPQEEYQELLNGIWDREWLTNNGQLVQELEKRLSNYLGLELLSFVSNGTIALQIAIKALDLQGEIITTPFSYIATTSSIVWEGCTPVFVDIDPKTLNIDPERIEAAITSKTSAILATHVFGNPCDINAIQMIADRYGLKVIYDAAHCFGTKYMGRSVFEYGDVSTTSFHATKLFHTVEGGAIFTNNEVLHEQINYMRNFGHSGLETFIGKGTNGKNSEFHAAMGLCNLKYVDQILNSRKKQSNVYKILLASASIQQLHIQKYAVWNYAYYPVIFENEEITLLVKEALEANEIFPRRYFYPSLDSLNIKSRGSVNISRDISKRILCLPLYDTLSIQQQHEIVKIIIRTIFTAYEKDINARSKSFSNSGN